MLYTPHLYQVNENRYSILINPIIITMIKIHERLHLIINDPIHGTIKLNSLEKAMINTPEFYRLRDIKQLGMEILYSH